MFHQAMKSGTKKFVGEHNFSNFCKMDAANVHNYKRHITSFEIAPCDTRHEDNQLFVIKIIGSAFLWHQVRCMVAVLFMIGQDLETPDVIDTLLDTNRTRRKPQYPMAPEIPLVLRSCEFEGLKFRCSSDALQAVRVHLKNECRMYLLQAAIFHEAFLSCLQLSNDIGMSNVKTVKKKASHVPLLSRQTEPSYEERRTKLENTKSRACSLVTAG
uniref:tRNA pseudouridine synthase n=1 Tax=Rhizophora mucronata TaxID=61149 RepID=A0A2P2LQK8_RHIMU